MGTGDEGGVLVIGIGAIFVIVMSRCHPGLGVLALIIVVILTMLVCAGDAQDQAISDAETRIKSLKGWDKTKGVSVFTHWKGEVGRVYLKYIVGKIKLQESKIAERENHLVYFRYCKTNNLPIPSMSLEELCLKDIRVSNWRLSQLLQDLDQGRQLVEVEALVIQERLREETQLKVYERELEVQEEARREFSEKLDRDEYTKMYAKLKWYQGGKLFIRILILIVILILGGVGVSYKQRLVDIVKPPSKELILLVDTINQTPSNSVVKLSGADVHYSLAKFSHNVNVRYIINGSNKRISYYVYKLNVCNRPWVVNWINKGVDFNFKFTNNSVDKFWNITCN